MARSDLIDGSRCEARDVVLGLPSSGLHTNGFSLVRELVGENDFDADLLLAPHRLYLDEVRELRTKADVKALAHVTGGGILGNLTRVLPEGVGVELDWGAWERPPVYAWLSEQGVEEAEQRRVFNLGVGMCAVVPEPDAEVGTVIGRLDVIGVLVSGEGTNLQALIDAGLPIACVASNRPGVRALERAQEAGIPAEVFPLDDYEGREARDGAMADWLQQHDVDLVVCAGYMHLLRPCFLERFPGRVINTHSAPLPEFPGAHPIEDVLAAGVPETAATVHLVDNGMDSGPVLAAEPVPVRTGDDADTLRARVQEVEHRLLPRVVRELIA